MDKYEALKYYFGYDSFRGIQEECIDSVMMGNDTICVMATGGGKSITFQIPGIILEGMTLVISPLISLMNDQVMNLKKIGLEAGTINSSTTIFEEEKIINMIKNNTLKFLYLSPERLLNPKYETILTDSKLSQIVLDESHCLSQWGHDFRPSYYKIIDFIKKLKIKPVISCFTATADDLVISDMIKALKINPMVFKSSFDRPRLYYATIKCQDKLAYTYNFIKEHKNEAGIIYTITRKRTEKLYNQILNMGYKVSMYHGGLEDDIKKKNQNDFLNGNSQIMIATNSFGLGIDHKCVRYVINYDLPSSIEDLAQQQGRCSRDGKEGTCILLYDENDLSINEYFINQLEDNYNLTQEEIRALKKRKRKKLEDVIKYATTKDCLHKYLVNYFGQRHESYCFNCSNCLDSYEYKNVIKDARLIVEFIMHYSNRFGMELISRVFAGEKTEQIKRHNLNYSIYFGKIKDAFYVKEIIFSLICDGYIIKSNGKYPTLSTSKKLKELFYINKYKIKKYKR